MKEVGKSSLWVEKYRPRTISDIILSEKQTRYFGSIKEEGEIPNMLFYSSPGTGKTSVAKALGKDLGCDVLYLNGALNLSVDVVRHDVQQFASTHGLLSGKKLLIFDEIDRMKTTDVQETLKVTMEELEANARFIFCTNNYHKIIPALHSRLQPIDFRPSQKDMKGMMVKSFKRIQFILDDQNVEYDKKILADFVMKHYPDMRLIINHLQMYAGFNDRKIDEDIIGFVNSEKLFKAIFVAMRAKKWKDLRTLAAQIDPSEFYTYFYQHAICNDMSDETSMKALFILREASRDHSMSTDPEIVLASCLAEMMTTITWK